MNLPNYEVHHVTMSEFVNMENMDLNEHFAKNLSEKIEVEKQKQDESLNQLKNEFFEMQDRYMSGVSAISRILEKR